MSEQGKGGTGGRGKGEAHLKLTQELAWRKNFCGG
jgi:hypothetical protein